jgi:hypothetical protein
MNNTAENVGAHTPSLGRVLIVPEEVRQIVRELLKSELERIEQAQEICQTHHIHRPAFDERARMLGTMIRELAR